MFFTQQMHWDAFRLEVWNTYLEIVTSNLQGNAPIPPDEGSAVKSGKKKTTCDIQLHFRYRADLIDYDFSPWKASNTSNIMTLFKLT